MFRFLFALLYFALRKLFGHTRRAITRWVNWCIRVSRDNGMVRRFRSPDLCKYKDTKTRGEGPRSVFVRSGPLRVNRTWGLTV